MDQHSRMLLEDQGKLHKMAYVGDYDPADSDKIVKKIDPKKDEKTKGQGVRFYAHGVRVSCSNFLHLGSFSAFIDEACCCFAISRVHEMAGPKSVQICLFASVSSADDARYSDTE